MLRHILSFLLLVLFTTSCSLIQKEQSSDPLFTQATDERTKQLLALKDWQIKGKIAFINAKERSSADLNWRFKGSENSQKLNLTSYLGINVLQLETIEGAHALEVDGKTYHAENLDSLIASLTGLTLPTEALSYWVKGIAYSDKDHITYQSNSKLPQTLDSIYNHQHWHIEFQRYKNIKGVQLPTSLKISQANLTIRISINYWHL